MLAFCYYIYKYFFVLDVLLKHKLICTIIIGTMTHANLYSFRDF